MSIDAIHRMTFDSVSNSHGPSKIASAAPVGPDEHVAGADASSLGDGFKKALGDARALDQNASEMAEKFANNDASVGIHEVMIASEKANIALKYATTLKNKALEAYHELMATQV